MLVNKFQEAISEASGFALYNADPEDSAHRDAHSVLNDFARGLEGMPEIRAEVTPYPHLQEFSQALLSRDETTIGQYIQAITDWAFPTCSVCMEAVQRSHSRVLSCGHAYNDICLKQWVSKAAEDGMPMGHGTHQLKGPSCPDCRTPFTAATFWPELAAADALHAAPSYERARQEGGTLLLPPEMLTVNEEGMEWEDGNAVTDEPHYEGGWPSIEYMTANYLHDFDQYSFAFLNRIRVTRSTSPAQILACINHAWSGEYGMDSVNIVLGNDHPSVIATVHSEAVNLNMVRDLLREAAIRYDASGSA